MAKGNLFQGMAHGAVGDVVFYRQNGQQMSRVRNRHPHNPNTDAQLYQRAIMATIMRAYSAGKVLFDHSFETISVGQQTQSLFISSNAKILRTLCAAEIGSVPTETDPHSDVRARVVSRGSHFPTGFDGMKVSEGSYPQVFFQVIPAVSPSPTDDGTPLTFHMPTVIAGETVSAYCQRVGIIADDLYTLCGFSTFGNTVVDGYDDGFSRMGFAIEQEFFYIRLRIRSDLSTTKLASQATLADIATLDFVAGDTFEPAKLLLKPLGSSFTLNDVRVTTLGNQQFAWANFIRSHVNSKLRSSTVLLREWTYQNVGIVPAYIVPAWTPGSSLLGSSELILEGADE